MNETYARDLDLNLLRVFVVVAEAGSVTAAATRLYLTQPAVSASLRRLASAIGGTLFVRQGRGLVLTDRGRRLLADARPHLHALVDATASQPAFDPLTSDRVVRLGLADTNEAWLLPALLRRFEDIAPRLRVIALPVQFRTVGDALLAGAIDAAVTVADELPSSIRRSALFHGGFVALFDPTRLALGSRVSEAAYFAAEHVIVSYNGDLRGVIEDMMRRSRKVRCSVSSFANIGAIVEGSSLVATVPKLVAEQLLRASPQLRTASLPFAMGGAPMELLWPAARDDDPLGKFVRQQLTFVCDELLGRAKPKRARQPAAQRKPLLA
ncbi:MAG: LysR family transcriptional regulator [Deltaproteobacteria bacterium]|nr:LysR family transcriptional regulator [Nannocystaceae bacterium]